MLATRSHRLSVKTEGTDSGGQYDLGNTAEFTKSTCDPQDEGRDFPMEGASEKWWHWS